MSNAYEALKADALRIASELDDHNATLDRKARNMIRELLAEREALRSKTFLGRILRWFRLP